MTAPTTKPASVADVIRKAAEDAENVSYLTDARRVADDLRAALPRAEALEALVKAAHEMQVCMEDEPSSYRSALEGLTDALRRVREAK